MASSGLPWLPVDSNGQMWFTAERKRSKMPNKPVGWQSNLYMSCTINRAPKFVFCRPGECDNPSKRTTKSLFVSLGWFFAAIKVKGSTSGSKLISKGEASKEGRNFRGDALSWCIKSRVCRVKRTNCATEMMPVVVRNCFLGQQTRTGSLSGSSWNFTSNQLASAYQLG